MDGISPSGAAGYRQTDALPKGNTGKKMPEDGAQNPASVDRFVKAPPKNTQAYTPEDLIYKAKEKADPRKNRSENDVETLNSALAASEKTVSAFREMIRKLLERQAESRGAKRAETLGESLAKVGIPQAVADEIDRLSEKYGPAELTGEAGEKEFWGVEATARRIFDFAVSLSGGDKENMKVLRESVHKAFAECEKLFGGKLPDISYQTLDKINSLFDEYEKPQSPEAQEMYA